MTYFYLKRAGEVHSVQNACIRGTSSVQNIFSVVSISRKICDQVYLTYRRKQFFSCCLDPFTVWIQFHVEVQEHSLCVDEFLDKW